MTPALDPAAVRRLRPQHPRPPSGGLLGTLREAERQPGGNPVPALTVFLAGAECPFSCVFCDLWRHTHPTPTPPGALPTQLRQALAEEASSGASAPIVKLYNASNLFDPRAVPEADDAELQRLLADRERVVVESHPRLVGERAVRWSRDLAGTLEVAMGLETTDPRAQPRLGKAATLDDFRRAAERLHRVGAAVRCFVLIGVPYVPLPDQPASVAASVAFAVELGARHVSLLPLRGGNGALEALVATGDHRPATLDLVEQCLLASMASAGEAVLTVDLWDLELLASCSACFPARRERLRQHNLTGRFSPTPDAPCACTCEG